MQKNWCLKVVLFISAIVFCAAGIFGQTPNGKARLFKLIGTERSGDKSLSIAAVEQQQVEINFAVLTSTERREIEIPDLDGNVYQAVRRETEGLVRKNADTFTWNGKIYDSDFEGDVILTVHKNAMCGLIYTPSGVYDITPQAGGGHILVKIDQNSFPEEHPGDYFDWERENSRRNSIVLNQRNSLFSNQNFFETDSSSKPSAPSLDNGSTIDVMIVYTTPVKTALGGTTQADAFAAQAVAATNTAYANSGITPRVRLVHSMEVSYSEGATLLPALTWVKNDATVAAARDTYKADAVGIIVQNATDACGLGYLMANGGNSTAFAPNAFTATVRSCAVDNLSYPHELGHNQGANHNPADTGATPAQAVYTYSFGHCVSGSGITFFRTVMSYAGTECGASTQRRPYFSNPLINYMSQPTGTTDRNNALTINSTALNFSRFRESAAPTSAIVIIGGRVTNSTGGAIESAKVTITDSLGTGRTMETSLSGEYKFGNCRVGETYIVSVSDSRYSFVQPSQVLSVNNGENEVNFIALPTAKSRKRVRFF